MLELGGCDPYLILEDADLELAAENCIHSRMNNAGQSCIAAKRLIVVEKIRKDFEALVIEKTKSYLINDPLDKNKTHVSRSHRHANSHISPIQEVDNNLGNVIIETKPSQSLQEDSHSQKKSHSKDRKHYHGHKHRHGHDHKHRHRHSHTHSNKKES